jgi:hypothetical protein
MNYDGGWSARDPLAHRKMTDAQKELCKPQMSG